MADNLHVLLVGLLQAMTHAQLSEEPQRAAGLVVPYPEGFSKRQRIDQALANLTEEELARIALRFAVDRKDVDLDEAARKILEAGDPPLSRITRRDIARVFGDDLAGERGTVEIGGFAVNEMKIWRFEEPLPNDAEVLGRYSVNPPSVYGFGHQAYYEHVVRCIVNGEPQLVDGLEGRRSLELISAIYESVETGREVALRFTPRLCRLGQRPVLADAR